MEKITTTDGYTAQELEVINQSFARIVTIMDELREHCPWDRKQTIESLRILSIEELYELVDAIDRQDFMQIKEELGDLLLHILFYAKIAKEQNAFTLNTMIDDLCAKIIHRHPHIYSDVKVKDEEEVKKNWEQLKLKEGKKSILQGVPQSLPAMVKAQRIQEKVKQVGFDWENKNQVWEKVQEEISEFQTEIENQNQDKAEQEFGDVIFALINYARFCNIDPERALERTNQKFIHRFTSMEAAISQDHKAMKEMTLEEMDVYWNAMKKQNQ